MTGRILVVDDIDANIKLLRVKLEAEYYEVITAISGEAAIELACHEQPDLILLDVMMPGLSGYETCQCLKEDASTRHIPIILVTALDGREDRLQGLEAGADDFLTKPIDDVLLMARVKALIRLKILSDELRQREATTRRAGLTDQDIYHRLMDAPGNVLILDDNERAAAKLLNLIGTQHRCAYEFDPEKVMRILGGRVDLLVLNLIADGYDALRLVAQLRAMESTRQRPILGLLRAEDRDIMLKAFDLGVDDIIYRPLDTQEMLARSKTLVRRKRYGDFLRQSLDQSLELAVLDPLTGLNNRRYMMTRLTQFMHSARKNAKPISILLFDIDHFKGVNDTWGHDCGDEVLKDFSLRLATHVRAMDIPCRMGGEEFVVIMPDTGPEDAQGIAERVRIMVADKSFPIKGGLERISVTVSIGVSTSYGPPDTIPELLKRADEAVYEAKSSGRNRVIVRDAA